MIPIPFYPLGSTPPPANPSTNLPTQVIPISPFYPDFSNYMHGHHPLLPHLWLPPPFVDFPDANPSTWTSQGNPRPPFDSSLNPPSGLHPASLSNVDEIQDARTACTPSVDDIVHTKGADTVHIEGADIVEEPKLGMMFNSKDELLAYYKRYGQQ